MNNNATNFSLEASFVDLNSNAVGNFSRSSMVHLEREVDGGVQLYPIPAHAPAFYSEDGAFLLEPAGINLLTWPLALNQNVWLKGSNVIIQPDESVAPDSSHLADRVIWAPGNGATQLLKRTLQLDASKSYTLSIFLRSRGATFTNADVLRVTGDVVGTPAISLSVLNQFPNRYRLEELTLTFKATGQEPKLPNNPHEATDYAVTAVTNNTITFITANSIGVNDLVGGQAFFNNVVNRFFKITANTGGSGGAVTLTLDVANLVAEGVSTASRVILAAAPKQNVTIEFYCESTAAVDWGGIQLEERPFRSSMIYQEGELNVRAATQLSFRNSPVANLRTFGVFAELKLWRGDGNLWDFGNFKAWIAQNKLFVQAGATTISTPDNLPGQGAKIFAQVAEGSSSLSLYVNGILKARSALTGFVADLNANLTFTSDGVRAFQRFLTTDQLLLDGQPTVGSLAGQDVGEMFKSILLIDATAISAHAPLLNLPPVTVPAPEAPIAKSPITAINTATNVVTVGDGTGFIISKPVTAMRGNIIIVRATVTNISGANITLNTTAGIVIGDLLIYGNVDQAGHASVRFPFDPVDQQIITAIDVATKRLTVASTLSFTKQRAFITIPLYQDIAEVIIKNIDNTNGYLFVDNVTNIAVGNVIQQPFNELIISPANYFAGLLNPVDKVAIAQKWANGLVIENRNPVPVTVRPYLRVYL
ncbi:MULTISPECIES: hypothetical protein [Trichocoleus]|uniref:Uncharacterized protein n=1 Tax=Trichocoleus desertorum GB2-A4 TaxID=2933944 RepID=A0ABV0JCM2_9CYAN|nr:hypothetical protein [Trichocoleus sp. FACHB-46]MBD1864182.1 hypothetical protein [Trichocoleus sp. FACHB-46]